MYPPEILEILRESKDKNCFIDYMKYSITKREIQYCALGTIAKHNNIPNWRIYLGTFIRRDLKKIYGLEKTPIMACPDCGARSGFMSLIAHLNDDHYYNWGKVADKLEIARPYDNTQSFFKKIKDTFRIFPNH